jgi:phytoene dehydrogenase-like protein
VEVIEMNDPANQTQVTDVVVVGAGLAGLAAAATAARHGADVTVLEARSVGGRARSVDRDGFTLNEGAHALYRAGPGAAVLADLDVRFAGAQPRLSSYHTWWDGELATLPLTPTALLSTRLLGARSKATAARLLAGLGRSAAAAPPVSFAQWLDDHGVRSDLMKLLATITRLTTYAADPLSLPASAALRQLALGQGGVWYVNGGWQTLVDGLAVAARSAGAVVHPASSVTALERDGGRWVVTTRSEGGDSRTVAASSVVLAAGGPALAERLAGPVPTG